MEMLPVRKDADLSCNLHRLLRNFFGAQVGVFVQRARCGQRKRAAGTDADDAVIRLDEIAGS